jgi:hypothetical protein
MARQRQKSRGNILRTKLCYHKIYMQSSILRALIASVSLAAVSVIFFQNCTNVNLKPLSVASVCEDCIGVEKGK